MRLVVALATGTNSLSTWLCASDAGQRLEPRACRPHPTPAAAPFLAAQQVLVEYAPAEVDAFIAFADAGESLLR